MRDSELEKYMEPSLYRILCADKNASEALIKDSWKGLQKTFHPDKNRGNEAWAQEKIQEINFAYNVLSKPELKSRYDALFEKYLKLKAKEKREAERLKVIKKLKLVQEKPSSKMHSYIISYDLKGKPPNDYLELIETIKHFANWWHHLESTWIIRSGLSVEKVRDKLIPHIGSKDKLFVATLSGEAAWIGIVKEGSNWIKENL